MTPRTQSAARDAMAWPAEDPKRPGCCNRWVAREYGLRCNRPLHHRGGCSREATPGDQRLRIDPELEADFREPIDWLDRNVIALLAFLALAAWFTLLGFAVTLHWLWQTAARALGVV